MWRGGGAVEMLEMCVRHIQVVVKNYGQNTTLVMLTVLMFHLPAVCGLFLEQTLSL